MIILYDLFQRIQRNIKLPGGIFRFKRKTDGALG